jgi:glycine dehydrogenase subunit 1
MFLPHTNQDREAMLKTIGASSLEELFQVVPAKHRFPELNLPPTQTEMEVVSELKDISDANESTDDLINFLGAGAYNHFIPAAIDAIISRGEFLTAYTPYQPEVSQGTLQAIFDYQSLVAALTGMDASNASHYDGATAVAEAVSMAFANFRGKRKKVVFSRAVHPQYHQTVQTYHHGTGINLVEAPTSLSDGPEGLLPLIDEDTALVVVQYPDFFGRIYDYSRSRP